MSPDKGGWLPSLSLEFAVVYAIVCTLLKDDKKVLVIS